MKNYQVGKWNEKVLRRGEVVDKMARVGLRFLP